MTKVGKTLIGVLVAVDLAFVFYIMSPQIEHSGSKSDDSAEAAAKGAELEAGVIASASSGAQVTSGSIAGNTSDSATPNSTSSAGRIAAAPPPAASNAGRIAAVPPPKPVAVPNVLLDRKSASAAVAAAPPPTPAPAPAAAGSANEERVAVRQQPVKTVDVTNARKSGEAKTSVASRSERAAEDARSSASNAGSGAGSNAVGAAMTEALVRQSAVLDPNLPPPDMSKSVSMHDVSDTSSRGGANPVAAAMTEQLVRESTRFTPPTQHAPTQPGAQ
jgi:resuscitation-promoting factor RpfA